MTPGKFDFNMYRGDTYSWRFILWIDEEKTDPVILTGAVVEAEIRDKPGGMAIIELPCTIVPPNIIDVTMTPQNYVGCPAKGVWDMQIIYPNGIVNTPIGGSISITPDVTGSTGMVLDASRKWAP